MPGLSHTEPSALAWDVFPCCCAQLCIPAFCAEHLQQADWCSMLCVLSACPSGRIVHTKSALLWQDFVFLLCGQTADQRVPLLGKGSIVKLSQVLQAGGIQCAVPSRDLADFLVLFIYKSTHTGHTANCK